MKKPNPIVVGTYEEKVPKRDIFGYEVSGQYSLVERNVYLSVSRNKANLARLKKIRDWIDRAIQWIEQSQ